MDKYKEQLNKIAFSDEIYQKMVAVGEKYILHIDQLGELSAEIRDTIMGIHPAQRFTENIQERLEIDVTKAIDISKDVDADIFKFIKSRMEEFIVPESSKAKIAPPSLYNDSALKKEAVLADLENIDKLKPQNASNFVEHLLANPVSRPAQVEVKKLEPTPTPPPPPVPTTTPPPTANIPKPSVDPYREQF